MKKIIIPIISLILCSFIISDIRSKYVIPIGAKGVCSVDIDLDGDLDIATTHSSTDWSGIYLLKNENNGLFYYMDSVFFPSGSQKIIPEKIFSNTYPDLITSNSNSINVLLYDGLEFESLSFNAGCRVYDFDIGDVDNDGDNDIVFSSNQDFKWGIIYNLQNNTFSEPVIHNLSFPPLDISCDDVDNNGFSDIIINGTETIIFFYNEFEPDSLNLNIFSYDSKISDLNNDSELDIISLNDLHSKSYIYLFRNNGDRQFQIIDTLELDEGFKDFYIGDFNNDDLDDLIFLPHSSNNYYLLYNLGDFDFSDPQLINIDYFGETAWFFNSGDMDGNGYLDILTTRRFTYNDINSTVEILYNDGNGNFLDSPMITLDSNLIDSTDLKIYPNPVNDKFNIEFNLSSESLVEISILDIFGNLIANVLSKRLSQSHHSIVVDLNNESLTYLEKGVYLINLTINKSIIRTKKIILI